MRKLRRETLPRIPAAPNGIVLQASADSVASPLARAPTPSNQAARADRPPCETLSVRVNTGRENKWSSGLAIAVAIVILGIFRDSFIELIGRWSREPEYSHGFFVPVFAVVLLWVRRAQVIGQPWVGSWWGLVLVATGMAMRATSVFGFYVLLGALALLPTLAGLSMLAGGRRALRWALPSIVMLGLMIPLPGAVANLLTHPLQRIATISSTYVLQLIGIAAVDEGNVILQADGAIGVVEACSGLRMLILFFAVSTGVALLVKRELWERVLLVMSAIPIALLVNIARISLTGVILEIDPQAAETFFHDLAGWLMGPAALAVLWLEMKFLDRAMEALPAGPLLLGAPRTQKA